MAVLPPEYLDAQHAAGRRSSPTGCATAYHRPDARRRSVARIAAGGHRAAAASPGHDRRLADPRRVQRRRVPHRPVLAGAWWPRCLERRPPRYRPTAGRSTGCRSTSSRSAAAPAGRSSATTQPRSSCSGCRSILHRLVDANEDYWERGAGATPPPTDVRYDNLGIYGWDVRDALSYTAGRGGDPAGRVAAARRPARRQSRPTTTTSPRAPCSPPFGPRRHPDRRRGAGTAPTAASTRLVVALGANNALDAVVDKDVSWSGAGYDDPRRQGQATTSGGRPTSPWSTAAWSTRSARSAPGGWCWPPSRT